MFSNLMWFVSVPAHFRTRSFNQSGIAGRAIVLSCEAEGDLPIRITWNSHGSSAVYTKQTTSSAVSELHLERLSRQHAGVYRCTASNAFGYDHMAIFLSIKGESLLESVWRESISNSS